MGDACGSPSWPCVLSEIAGSGYVGTELGDWGFMPTEPGRLAEALTTHGLEMVGGFVPVAMADDGTHASGVARAVEVAKLMAAVAPNALLVLSDDNATDPVRTRHAGRITTEHGLSESRWDTFARGAMQIAAAVREQSGLRTVFHHHCGGYVETPAEVATLLERTDPTLLGLCLDTGHWTFGGGDPVAAFDQYRDRIWHVHFKDCSESVARTVRCEGLSYTEAVAAGVFCELGTGSVDFATLSARLNDSGYDRWIVVEQDVFAGSGCPNVSAKNNRAFLRGLGL